MRHTSYHERPDISIGVSSEVVSEIRKNCHLDPLQLRTHLAARFDIKDVTAKQIYYWWSNSVQSKYQRHKDPIPVSNSSARGISSKGMPPSDVN